MKKSDIPDTGTVSVVPKLVTKKTGSPWTPIWFWNRISILKLKSYLQYGNTVIVEVCGGLLTILVLLAVFVPTTPPLLCLTTIPSSPESLFTLHCTVN